MARTTRKTDRPDIGGTPKWGMILVALITFLVFSPSLFNGWVNWDDDHYVLNNPLVQHLSAEQIQEMFTTLQVQGNYHPVTLLSLAVDHQIAGTNPLMFHLSNLLFHLFNTVLLLLFVYFLTDRIYIAIITALLFGIHPMHVESVAWISERKDVLYTFFFLWGLILYLQYLQQTRRSYLWLGLCMLAFVLSILSKGMAVTFPLILLLIDYLQERTDYRRLMLEKVPFFLLSLGGGILTIIAQRAGQALSHAPDVSLIESMAIASYGLCLYTIKLLFPFQLSTLHPYPMGLGEAVPSYMYLSVIGTIALAYLAWRGIRYRRACGFGIGVYLVSLAPVLQVLPVGNAMIAERYTYIAYIGLFFLIGWAIDQYLQRKSPDIPAYKNRLMLGFAVYLCCMMSLTLMRIPVWKNGETLWTDVMQTYPDHYYSYASRGMYWIEQQQPTKAMADFQDALIRNPGFADGYVNRGMLYAQAGDYERAISDYDQAISLDSLHYLPYLNRGAIFRITNRPQEALSDLNRAIQLNPSDVLSYHNRGLLHKQSQQYEAAIQDFSAALNLAPNNPSLWYERGWVYALVGNFSMAEQDFTTAISLQPDYAQAYFYRSMTYRELGKKEMALQDALRAQQLGLEIDSEYVEALQE